MSFLSLPPSEMTDDEERPMLSRLVNRLLSLGGSTLEADLVGERGVVSGGEVVVVVVDDVVGVEGIAFVVELVGVSAVGEEPGLCFDCD